MKQRVLCLIVLAAAVSGNVLRAGKTTYSDGIAAVVNDQVITVFDVMRETRQLELAMQQNVSGQEFAERAMALREDVAKRLIDRALIYEEYKRRDFQLPERFINERLDEIIVERANGDWRKFEEDLEENGLSMTEFKERLEQQLAVDVIISQLVRRPAHVTPSEVTEHYEDNKTLYGEPSQVHLRIIAVQRDDKTDDEQQALAQKITQALQGGREFPAVASEFSDDMSAERGGDVGWIDTTTGRKEFINAIKTLDKGDISDPVRLDEAIYWLQLVDTKDAVVQPLDDALRKEIEATLLEGKRQKRYDEFLKELREKFYVKTYF